MTPRAIIRTGGGMTGRGCEGGLRSLSSSFPRRRESSSARGDAVVPRETRLGTPPARSMTALWERLHPHPTVIPAKAGIQSRAGRYSGAQEIEARYSACAEYDHAWRRGRIPTPPSFPRRRESSSARGDAVVPRGTRLGTPTARSMTALGERPHPPPHRHSREGGNPVSRRAGQWCLGDRGWVLRLRGV